ncbi:alcohol dehydrogenase catalytic domain-containing protein [Phototrophicus methaneseepsis]|uniref:Alcohol dehydrogenase catalytic domain-containing protein n=1 Tax=Phototrophicus methaneseepsis TaxID=2710758 RepID=A0A7S8EBY4_9CHLR|nr:alcohol dehydrogenase catalytic domain-containing protein [Phototrophicus methaneseepsis]QPC84170.1 alcohol dehydrogenase catalytic domain-containing protein [Phototrophicus methaneseepsis]
MKAVCLKGPRQVELVDVPVPDIANDQLLIRMGASTICTSDLNDIRANPFDIPLPVIIGHEAAGTVVGIGQDVTGFSLGDRITTHPVHPCGYCSACREGKQHLCLNMGHFGIDLQGTMAQYYYVRSDRARHIPDEMPFPLAALSEPVSVCLEALAQAKLKAGDSLLIMGDGPFGVLMARLAQTMDLAHVVVAGWQDFRLSFAKSAQKINTQHLEEPVPALLQPVDSGYDAVILAVGSAQAFHQGFQCLKPKGRLVVFSAIPEGAQVDLMTVHIKEMEIVGACNDQDRFDEAVQMLTNPALGIAELITHQFPLSQFEQALHLAENAHDQVMKIALIG